jgi:ubiquinone/menaquinone biosynthesis C-methylase UbiE
MSETPSYKKPEGKSGEELLDLMDKDHTPIALWSLTNLEVKEDDTTLDIGCGSGLNIKRLYEKSPKSKSYGVDYSSTSVKKSKMMNRDEVEKGNIIVEKANVLDMPFEDDKFDIITAFSTVFFWPDIINAFKEVRRVLKTGGKFFIVQGINGTDDFQPENDEDNDEGAVFYNDIEFKDMLQEAGYAKVTCVIRQRRENKKLVKTYIDGKYTEELFDDLCDDDINMDKQPTSPEWLCVIAEK